MSVLIAIMPQTVHDLSVAQITFEFMDKLYRTVATTDQRQYLIDNGLIPSLCKALSRFYQKWGTTNENCVQHMQTFATTIAQQAILSAGTMHVSQSNSIIEQKCLIVRFIDYLGLAKRA